MNHKAKDKPSINKAHVVAYSVVSIVATMWSWIFLCSVARLVKSTLAGYLLALFSFTVIVGLSSLVILLGIRYIWHLQARYSKPQWWIVVVVFFGWSAIEWLIAHLVALVWLGHAGSLDTVLPFTSFTPLISHTPLRYSGRLVGYYGLSSTVIVLLFCVLVKKYRKMAWAVVGIIIVINVSMWAVFRANNGSQIRVATVSENVLDRVPKISKPVDLVVFPEYGFDSSTKPSDRVASFGAGETYYVGSEEQHPASGKQNVLIFGSASRGIIEQRAKSRLIPGGEYVPFFADYALRLFGGTQAREFFVQNRAIERGAYNAQPLKMMNGVAIGSSVCASIIAPSDYQQFTKHGATVLTNSAALGIFQSGLFTFQHQGMAAFMASANARPFIQSANDADAFVINKDGNMTLRVSSKSSQLGIADITTNNRITPYSRFGEWPAAVGFMLIVGLLAAEYAQPNKKSTKK